MFRKHILDPVRFHMESSPEKPAFCISETFYSYADLGQWISRIRKALKNVQAGSHIGIVANDDIQTYASLFAIWFEGHAYVPLHPMQPRERNLEIISQADVKLVLASDGKHGFENQVVTSDLPETLLDLEPATADDSALAYILFTSGSTGKPKGVTLSRANIGAFVASFWKSGFEITADDRCLQCFDLTFDVSVQSFLTPLTKGACTFTVPHEEIKYSYVFGLLEDHELTFGAMAPSMLRYLQQYFDEIDIPSMRYCILTAEASPWSLVTQWQKCLPNAQLFNFYGPTEATIYCTYYKIPRQDAKTLNGIVCIGKPMDGVTALVLDAENRTLGPDQKGELCLAGDQLTPGYWENAEKNAEVFFEADLDGTQKRYYRTGDLCYFDAQGDLLYAGRLDHQVKIQGFRIELGEIEFHARNFAQGRNAVATDFTNSLNNTEIALIVETDEIDRDALLAELRRKLPPYMIPTKVLTASEFPLNANGKTDRKTLKEIINRTTLSHGQVSLS